MALKDFDQVIDDKGLVIICVTLLAGAGLFVLTGDNATTILQNCLSGLFGMAVGKAMGKE